MNRNVLLAAVFPAIFSICLLGMRNPCLHGNLRPKQHPRAILEESAKAPPEITKSHGLDVEAAQTEAILPELPGFPFFSRQFHESPPVKARRFVARAPPAVFSQPI